MNLWIRSQDKEELLVVNDIKIKNNFSKKIIEENYLPKGSTSYNKMKTVTSYIDDKYINSNVLVNGINIGTYKTKERALQILDEIQNILNPLIIFKNCEITKEELDNAIKEHAIMINGDSSSVEQLKVCVYEMPKE